MGDVFVMHAIEKVVETQVSFGKHVKLSAFNSLNGCTELFFRASMEYSGEKPP